MLFASAVFFCAGCANSSSGGKSAGGGGSGLSALQGRWELLPDEPGGVATPRQRVVKDVSGNTETVTTYGPTGQVLQAQTAQVRLSRSGPVHVYTAENPKVISGPGRGGAKPAPGAIRYVYRIHGSEFDEVWGLLPGQEEREVVVKRWRREGAGK
jgi:hypothetical protein